MYRVDARVTLFVALCAACAREASPPPSSDAVRSEITRTWDKFTTAWVAGSVSAATAAFFTMDAINSVPDAPESRGRAGIDSAFNAFRATTQVLASKNTTQEVDVAGDLAIERGSFTQTEQTGNAAPITREGRYLAVWKRQADGSWKCSRFLFNWAPR